MTYRSIAILIDYYYNTFTFFFFFTQKTNTISVLILYICAAEYARESNMQKSSLSKIGKLAIALGSVGVLFIVFLLVYWWAKRTREGIATFLFSILLLKACEYPTCYFNDGFKSLFVY